MDVPAPNDWAEELAGCARSFATGDCSALGRLFDLTAPRLLRYAQAITHSREDAEDAVQTAIVRIARNPQSLAAVAWPWAYMLRATRNEAFRILSRRRPFSFLTGVFATEESPSLSLESAERDAEVQKALQRLPLEQAEVVMLKIWEGLTFQEIAVITGETLNTVASRYRYALAKLECSLRRIADEVGYVVD